MYISRLSNNRYELIGQRQQGGVLSVVCGDLCALTRALEGDSSGLRRWNTLDIHSEQCKVRIVCAYCFVKSKQTKNTMYMQ